MSKRTRSQKIKAKLRTLKEQGIEISRSQLERDLGQKATTHERRKAKAAKEGVSVSSLIPDFIYTPEKRLRWIRNHATLPLTREFEKAVVKENEASRVMFSRIKSGHKDSDKDYRTMLGEVLVRRPYLESDWSKQSIQHPLIGEFERAFSLKIGPRSKYRVTAYKQIIDNWTQVANVHITDAILKAFKLVDLSFPYVERWSLGNLGEVIQSLDKDKSAGYPWFAKKLEVISARERGDLGVLSLDQKFKDRAYSDMLDKLKKNRDLTLSENESVVTKVMKRLKLLDEGVLPRVVNFQGLRTESAAYTEQGKDPTKQRLVWGVPYDHTLIEKLFCGNLQEEVLNGDTGFSAHYWGSLQRHHTHEDRVLGLIDKAGEWGTSCISIDFSAFDQHITHPIMELAIQTFKSHSQLTPIEWQYLIYALLDSELWTSWGVLERHNGVPSGSFFTNLVDSTINAAFNEAVGIAFDCEVDYVVNGDDCCLVMEKEVPIEEIVKVGASFGMEMNEEKQWIRKDAFSFNKEVFSHELKGSTPMIHRVFNSIMRHDQRKRVLFDIEEVGAFYGHLRRLDHHPFKEVFLGWILDETMDPGGGSRFNPDRYVDEDLPALERFNASPEEKIPHSVTTYMDDWFWEIVSHV